MSNCALLILPDTFELGLGDAVLTWLRARMPICGTQWIAPLDRACLEALYPGTGGWNAGWELKLSLLRWGPSMLVEIPSDHWAEITHIKGSSNPWRASPGTLRSDLNAIGTVLSLVHGADHVEAAEADLRRLTNRQWCGQFPTDGKGVQSFPAALADALTLLGIEETEPCRAAANIERGRQRLAALEAALDTIICDIPTCLLADWRTWGEHTPTQIRAQLMNNRTPIDPWSDLVLSAGIHFFHHERRHVTA